MPIARIGYGTDFILENQAVGVATDTSDRTGLYVGGTTKANYNISGIASLTNYAGFVGRDQNIDGTVTLTGEYGTLGDIVVGIGSTFIVSSGSTVEVGTVPSVSIGTHFSPPTGNIEERPEAPVEGTVRFNRDLNTLEFYNGVEWRQFTVSGARGRGVFAGGYSGTIPSITKQIDYFDITTGGTAQEFGELNTGASNMGGCSSATRGFFTSGYTGPTKNNTIEYITIASASNGTDFGTRTTATYGANALSSSTRAIFCGGQGNPSPSPGVVNIIDYVEIATIGDAVDFGDAGVGRRYGATSSNGVRGFVMGSSLGPVAYSSQIDRITIASKGNTIDVGELTVDTFNANGCSNSTRSLIFLGEILPSPYAATKRTNAYEMSSTGNAHDFGDLTVARSRNSSCASNIRGITGGGSPAGLYMESILFSTKGSAEYFTDLNRDTTYDAAMIGVSDSHGGLGGY